MTTQDPPSDGVCSTCHKAWDDHAGMGPQLKCTGIGPKPEVKK